MLTAAAAIYQERENALEYMGQAGPVTAVLIVVMMGLGYLLARFLASGPQQRISIAIECGLQNGYFRETRQVLLPPSKPGVPQVPRPCRGQRARVRIPVYLREPLAKL